MLEYTFNSETDLGLLLGVLIQQRGFLISFLPMKVPVIAIFPFLFQGPLMIPWLASEGKVISGEMSSSEEKEIAGLPA